MSTLYVYPAPGPRATPRAYVRLSDKELTEWFGVTIPKDRVLPRVEIYIRKDKQQHLVFGVCFGPKGDVAISDTSKTATSNMTEPWMVHGLLRGYKVLKKEKFKMPSYSITKDALSNIKTVWFRLPNLPEHKPGEPMPYVTPRHVLKKLAEKKALSQGTAQVATLDGGKAEASKPAQLPLINPVIKPEDAAAIHIQTLRASLPRVNEAIKALIDHGMEVSCGVADNGQKFLLTVHEKI